MKKERKNQLSEIVNLAWAFVKRNGFTKSQALKIAWANIKLRTVMRQRIVKFYYQKISGEIREAYGTLQEKLLPPVTGSGRRPTLDYEIAADMLEEIFGKELFGEGEG